MRVRVRVLVGVLFLALVAGLIPDGVALADPTPTPKPAAGLLNEADAMRQARSSGKPVEVSALTDERTLVVADPDSGSFTAR